MQIVRLTKGQEFFSIAIGQRHHVPEHHGSHIVTTCDFNLGNVAMRFQRVQKRPERGNPFTYTWVKDGTAVDVCQEAIALFTEADQHRITLGYKPHPHTCFAAIAQLLRTHRRDPFLGLDAPKMGKMFPQGVFLERDLGVRRHVLETAAAA